MTSNVVLFLNINGFNLFVNCKNKKACFEIANIQSSCFSVTFITFYELLVIESFIKEHFISIIKLVFVAFIVSIILQI